MPIEPRVIPGLIAHEAVVAAVGMLGQLDQLVVRGAQACIVAAMPLRKPDTATPPPSPTKSARDRNATADASAGSSSTAGGAAPAAVDCTDGRTDDGLGSVRCITRCCCGCRGSGRSTTRG